MVNTLIFANLGHRPLRTFLTILAIAVEVTMILTLVGVSDGTLSSIRQRAKGVGADIVVRPPGSSIISLSGITMPDALVPLLSGVPGTNGAATLPPELAANVELATGTAVQPLSGFDSITGIVYSDFDKMSGGFHFLSGGPMVGPDDVIVDEYYAQQKKVKPGDSIKLANHVWHVSGVYSSGKLARVISKLDTLQEVAGANHKLSQIYIKLKDPSKVAPFVTGLKKFMNPNDPNEGYPIYSLEEFTSMLTVNSTPMLADFINVVIGVASIVGFITVFMAMYTAVLERTREIGILKAVGAGPGYILNILFRETILLAIFGTILGIILTFGTQYLMQHAVPASLVQETSYRWWPICLVIAVVGAMIGTVIPAMKAVKQDATEALSYE